jgi:UDPglucose 6-dehydrogenase
VITIVGLGFVGLTTALGFANKGYKVFGIDRDEGKLWKIRNGIVPFKEPYLRAELRKHLSRKFFPGSDISKAVSSSRVIIFCVGTPSDKDGNTNLTILTRAVKEVLAHVRKDRFVTFVIKSTVPPATCSNVIKPLMEKAGFKIGVNIGLVSNPEFLREGCAWADFIGSDRVVIGEHDKKSGDKAASLYEKFDCPVIRVSMNTSEFIKYLSNTMLSTLISFSNEMAMLAEKIGDINVKKAFKAVHLDKRWSGRANKMANYLFPGSGYGGSCLPKDTQAIFGTSRKLGFDAVMLRSNIETNKRIMEHTAQKIAFKLPKDAVIGILGLSFKPECDDVRATPAYTIIRMLLEKGYKNIIVFDPIAMPNFKKEYDFDIEYASTLKELAGKSDIAAIITGWEEFKDIGKYMKNKKIVDGRYIL